MDNPDYITVASLAAGYGGLELGIAEALGLPVRVVAVEIEAFPLTNLVAKAEEHQLVIDALWTDLRTVPYRKFRGCFDVLAAGFPCQPFSVAGKGLASADERHLWPAIDEGIGQCEPTIVFLENVPGIISAKTIEEYPRLQRYVESVAGRLGRDFAGNVHRRFCREFGTPVLLYVLRCLERRGYKATWGLFSSAENGAPHQRQRVFIMGYAERGGFDWDAWRGAGQESADRYCESSETSELADSNCNRDGQVARGDEKTEGVQGIYRKEICRGKSAGASHELGNAENADRRSGIEGIESKPQRRRHRSTDAGDELADACGDRGGEIYSQRGLSSHEEFIGDGIAGGTRWPARPGQKQFDWEEPRTVESGMGRTVDGFDSRVDELRLLGNGVDFRTAAKAFRGLLTELLTE